MLFVIQTVPRSVDYSSLCCLLLLYSYIIYILSKLVQEPLDNANSHGRSLGKVLQDYGISSSIAVTKL